MIDPLADPLAPTTTSHKPAREAACSPIGDATHPQPGDDQHRERTAAAATRPARVGRRQLVDLAARLPDRDRQILQTVLMLRLVRGDQLRRLFFSELTTESARTRVCRRSLQRLAEQGLLRVLERRIGGDRSGSAGHVYALAPAGRRLLARPHGQPMPSGRGVHEPGLLFVTHTLAIGDLYLSLVEADRASRLDLLAFEAEPVRTYTSPIGTTLRLKPDAYVRVGTGEFEQLSFCELDLGTEGRGALERKLNAYQSLYRSGREQAKHGLFPRVVWIAPDQDRADVIRSLVDALPAAAQKLFATTVKEHAVALLAGQDTPSTGAVA
jgi:hypothetical protein